MKRLERKWFETFDELSDWELDQQDDITVINIQEKNDMWYIYYYDNY